MAYPYTYFIPDIDETQDLIKTIKDNKYAVSVNDEPLKVKIGELEGYCIDYFHPQISAYMV